MSIRIVVKKNTYFDSVSLMSISTRANKLDGVEQAFVAMATEMNKGVLKNLGLLTPELEEAKSGDLMIVIKGASEAANDQTLVAIEELFTHKEQGGQHEARYATLASAKKHVPDSNLAVISVNGLFAAREARQALQNNLNVMLFSDNVSLEDELALKQLAHEKGLLMMGPDCGTAIINGIPLGFANVVNRGHIGVVGASGTGLQEVTCRIDQLGAGISQALGTGGHDLSEDIGGISMLFGLQALMDDDDTHVIVLISKPPSSVVAERILQLAQSAGKPVVVNFLGADPQTVTRPNVTAATTLAGAADLAVALLNKRPLTETRYQPSPSDLTALQQACQRLAPTRQAIRGVFAGGTFCYEAQLICQQNGFTAASNTPVSGNQTLANIWQSHNHTLIDMGDDDFTRGKPHPMIDPTLRNQRLLAELNDPQTAVVLFDLVLGYGASEAPAAELLEQLTQIDQQQAPLMIAHVCGTESDPQQRSRQVSALRDAGVIIADCNAQAAQWASIVAQIQIEKKEVIA